MGSATDTPHHQMMIPKAPVLTPSAREIVAIALDMWVFLQNAFCKPFWINATAKTKIAHVDFAATAKAHACDMERILRLAMKEQSQLSQQPTRATSTG